MHSAPQCPRAQGAEKGATASASAEAALRRKHKATQQSPSVLASGCSTVGQELQPYGVLRCSGRGSCHLVMQGTTWCAMLQRRVRRCNTLHDDATRLRTSFLFFMMIASMSCGETCSSVRTAHVRLCCAAAVLAVPCVLLAAALRACAC